MGHAFAVRQVVKRQMTVAGRSMRIGNRYRQGYVHVLQRMEAPGKGIEI